MANKSDKDKNKGGNGAHAVVEPSGESADGGGSVWGKIGKVVQQGADKLLPGDQLSADGQWQNGWQGALGLGAGLAGSFLGGPLAGSAIRQGANWAIDNYGEGASQDPFAYWTPTQPNYDLGLPNTMLPNGDASSDPFAWQGQYDLGLTSSFQPPAERQGMQSPYSDAFGQVDRGGVAGGGYGAHQPTAPAHMGGRPQTGVRPATPQAPTMTTQMPRSFLGGLVGRDYQLLNGLRGK